MKLMGLKTIENTQKMRFDWLKWLVVAALIIAGIIANNYYNSQPWPLRLLGWLFLLGITVAIALQTELGRKALVFSRESRMELRKVFWPTRQETIQTTLIVLVMVVVLALVLWVVDLGLMSLIGWLTGQRG
jgi:preprotein translocase subunit SecE